MRLLIADAEADQVQSALTHVNAPGASVLLNPQWITPDPSERLWIACGKAALTMVQAAGWIPKKGGVESNRGKLFQGIQPDGWTKPISLGVTYAPQIYHIEYSDFVKFECDIAIYRRYEQTGSMEAQLGDYRYTNDLSGVVAYCKAKYAQTGLPVELSLDLETEGLDPFNPNKKIVCIQATAKMGISDVVYTLTMTDARIAKLVKQVKWLATTPWIKIIGANFKYDMLWMRVKWGIAFTNFTFDTCNGGSLVEENRPNTLNIHTKVYSQDLGGYDDAFNATQNKANMGAVPKPILLPYAGGDTDACLRNYHHIRAALITDNPTPSGKPAKNSLTSMYVNIVHPALSALHRMEHTGVCVDIEKFHAFGADLEARQNEATAHAASVLPKSLMEKYGGLSATGGAPLSKPNMIAEFLFSPTGLNLKPLSVTEKTGKPSTAQHHLEQFKDHPDAAVVIEHYLDYKRVAKMHGTYYEGFLKHLRNDGRWHASYIIHKQGDGKNNDQAAAGTVTGRGSATDPAFQCVTGDAEIVTDKGIMAAQDIIDPLIPDQAHNPYRAHKMKIWGSTGWQETSNVFKSWRHDILRVKFQNGNELKCTPEHPIMTLRGWVKAKDIQLDDYLRPPTRHERRDAPPWITEELSEALGIIAATGKITAIWGQVQIQLPDVLGDRVATALVNGLGIEPELAVIEGDLVITFPTDKLTPAATLFAMTLPSKQNTGIHPDLRGTQAALACMRGLIRATGRFGHTDRYLPRLDLKVATKALALGLLRETALEGLIPPTISQKDDHWLVTWKFHSASEICNRIGHNPKGWSLPEHRQAKNKPHQSLKVLDVEDAGAGWVYDFTVPTTHDFYANGMLVHNTVPKHSYWGKRLRECIVAPDGHVILARDYSQGELKVTACWAGESQMIKAYQSGIDLHSLTAATVNGMSYEEAMFLKKNDYPAYEKLRQNGKAGNFGLIYGMSAYGFMMYADAVYGVKLTIEEAEAMRDAFFDLYPGLTAWHHKQIMEAHQYGYVRSPLGRLRHLPNINSPIKKIREGAEKQAINSPIQATLVDMMWWAMGTIERDKPHLLNPFAQIHDQGLWYTPEDKIDEALAYSGEIMEDLPFQKFFGWKPDLVFNTDAEVGLNLAGLEKVAA